MQVRTRVYAIRQVLRAARFDTTNAAMRPTKSMAALSVSPTSRTLLNKTEGWLPLCQRSEPVTQPALCWMAGCAFVPDTGDDKSGYVERRFQDLQSA